MGRVIRTLKHSWNIFRDAPRDPGFSTGSPYSYRQARSPARYYNDRSIIGSIYTRLSIDLSMVEFMHVKLNEDDVVTEIVKDSLHERLTLDANIDQTSQALKQDAALSMFEQGVIAIVPVDTTIDPSVSTSYDIGSMRVGRIVGWRPRHVTVELYDDRETDDSGEPINGGIVKQVTIPKDQVAIVENPFYNVMNEPNGTLTRLLMKLKDLDDDDAKYSSEKLDIIMQLPYAVRGASRKKQAEERRKDLSDQLKDDPLGIGYIDVSEKVIQLNRPINSRLPEEIQNLKDQLYAELGLTPEIMNGSANRDTINNYFDRTIEPIANAFALEFKRKFLTKTARTQRHSIEIYRDPLKLIPLSELPEVADKLIRNAILTANEFRPKIGYRPSSQEQANKLVNPNMPLDDQLPPTEPRPQRKVVDNG